MPANSSRPRSPVQPGNGRRARPNVPYPTIPPPSDGMPSVDQVAPPLLDSAFEYVRVSFAVSLPDRTSRPGGL